MTIKKEKKYKWKESFKSLGDALDRLEEALELEPDQHQVIIDGTIQRFEFTFELFWKTFKRVLFFEGIETNTPRETLETAYQLKWINHEQLWLKMLQDRNETSHIYDEKKAKEVYDRIKKYFPIFREAYSLLDQKLKKK
jgi:nucleotidyltransferase substrate binding protein (TIGR01987 family)